jgi:hypothetical protein
MQFAAENFTANFTAASAQAPKLTSHSSHVTENTSAHPQRERLLTGGLKYIGQY